MTGTYQLPRSAPEAQGIASAAVLGFVEAVEQRGLALHSMMLLRHGHVVAEGWWQPCAPDVPHMLFSLSKSFTSTAVGFAVTEGLLSVEDHVLQFFPDDAPADPAANLKAMRVRHLLTMTTGHEEDTLPRLTRQQNGNWVRAFLAAPPEREPGTYFVYNNGASYMLSAIVQRVTGMTVLDYLEPRLFAPLGITGATWEQSPQGINTGGWGLKAKTGDIARFGQMYLQKGMWNGQQILPKAWVEEATRYQVDNSNQGNPDWQQGYGYQFWRCRHNAYRGDGAFGQFCVVMPEQDAVLATTAGLQDMQAVLNLVWERLLPAMQPGALAEDQAALAQLTEKLANLALLPQTGNASSPMAARVAGKTFRMDDNELQIKAMRFDFDGERSILSLRDERGEHQVQCSSGAWRKGTTTLSSGGPPSLNNHAPQPVAASGAWTADDTYTAQICLYETPFIYTLACRFADDQVFVNMRQNVSFGPTEWPQIAGRVA